eukprot:TRINITY_DN8614_c0_g1_i1.p1 TRINITY_DN8614_c0_g1~~TRINITY_DN8614_c0_g1_i1.p1  ORF type:complete len:664 (+),score=171.25 TRINITY_DN8614_c0_g1_i1:78-2069(+)
MQSLCSAPLPGSRDCGADSHEERENENKEEMEKLKRNEQENDKVKEEAKENEKVNEEDQKENVKEKEEEQTDEEQEREPEEEDDEQKEDETEEEAQEGEEEEEKSEEEKEEDEEEQQEENEAEEEDVNEEANQDPVRWKLRTNEWLARARGQKEEALPFVAMEALTILKSLCMMLESFDRRLRQLRVDLECLDDGDAESLFDTPGWLQVEICTIDNVSGAVLDLHASAKTWYGHVKAHLCSGLDSASEVTIDTTANALHMSTSSVVAFVDESVVAFNDLQRRVGSVAARRRAAVARARAAIETLAAEERSSACALLAKAMEPANHVDFVCITEVCQRVADRPAEAADAVKFLVSALLSEDCRIALKALTIINEMLYDRHALMELAAMNDAALLPLQILRKRRLAEDTGHGRATGECIRMLATEVERKIIESRSLGIGRGSRARGGGGRDGSDDNISSDSAAGTTTVLSHIFERASTSGRALFQQFGWLQTRAAASRIVAWNGDGEGALRGRAGAASLALRLRAAHSRRSIIQWAGASSANVHDVFHTFSAYAARLAKLHEELDCLNDSSIGLSLDVELHRIASLILAATDVQARAQDWQGAFQHNQSSPKSPAARAVQLADFFEEAVASADELERCLVGLFEVRRKVVERAKATIEANPPAPS